MTYALVIDPAQAALAPGRAAQRPATTPVHPADSAQTSHGASDFMAHLRAGVNYARGRVLHDYPALSRSRAESPLPVHTDPVHGAPLDQLPLDDVRSDGALFGVSTSRDGEDERPFPHISAPGQQSALAELVRSYRYALLLC